MGVGGTCSYTELLNVLSWKEPLRLSSSSPLTVAVAPSTRPGCSKHHLSWSPWMKHPNFSEESVPELHHHHSEEFLLNV